MTYAQHRVKRSDGVSDEAARNTVSTNYQVRYGPLKVLRGIITSKMIDILS
jgi:hypothetical protein